MKDLSFLRLLAEQYPTEAAAADALVRLTAALELPKGTEFFFSDLHGEHEAFIHLLRSASGVIREKIENLFGQAMLESDRAELAALIYYPEHQLVYKKQTCPRFDEWCEITLNRLISVCREVTAKYARGKVRATMSPDYADILEELLGVEERDEDKLRYYRTMIAAAIRSGAAWSIILELCRLIRQISVDHLHILGDIFDRGPRADRILDELMRYHDVDIQWGNHDISWMGAFCGNRVCLANVLRIAIRYNNFDLLEDGYGVNLRPLSMFANEVYADDPCTLFQPQILDENQYDPIEPQLAARMHKAIAIIGFKLEGQLAARHPEYGMDGRRLLHCIDREAGTITLLDGIFPLRDTYLPTVHPDDPYALTAEEHTVLEQLYGSFRHSAPLRRHIEYLYSHGAMYKCINGNLLYHGCIPMREDGSFEEWTDGRHRYTGKSLFDRIDTLVRRAYYEGDTEAIDLMWYFWCGAQSPLFGKDRMTTFERYFLEDKCTHTEKSNAYYTLYERPETCSRILESFGMDPRVSHIVNGHVPVRQGENPIKAGGRLFVIDGGISKAYQSKTGIAGYTLIYNSHYLALAEHEAYSPMSADGVPSQIFAKLRIAEMMPRRRTVGDTDAGARLAARVHDLQALLRLYRGGEKLMEKEEMHYG